MARADEHHVAHAGGHHCRAAQNESPHQDRPEFGMGLDQRQHLVAIQFDGFPWLRDAHAKERPAARKQVHLARELARTMDPNRGLHSARGVDHLQFARDHEVKGYGAVARFNEHRARA